MQSESNFEKDPNSLTPLNKRAGRFLLTEKLGSGTDGTVYKGHDPVIDRDVAIKILTPPANPAERKSREQQFINEARAAGRLSHPNIVTIFDTSVENGTTFIAMEFLPGRDLRGELNSGRKFDIIEAANIVQKIADALHFAHQNGVIHRDIKPGNIFVLPNGQPKVVDFGIARAPNRVHTPGNTGGATLFHNNVMGTPNYMSPEQAMGRNVDEKTDIYSLGAVLYELIAGVKPFPSQDMDKLLQQIIHKSPKPIANYAPNVPEQLVRIIVKAMQKDPKQRYQTAGEMSAALMQFLERDRKLKRKRKNGDAGAAPEAGNALPWVSIVAIVIAIACIGTYYFLR